MHDLLGTPLAIVPARMRRLGTRWDEHPHEVDAKFAKVAKVAKVKACKGPARR